MRAVNTTPCTLNYNSLYHQLDKDLIRQTFYVCWTENTSLSPGLLDSSPAHMALTMIGYFADLRDERHLLGCYLSLLSYYGQRTEQLVIMTRYAVSHFLNYTAFCKIPAPCNAANILIIRGSAGGEIKTYSRSQYYNVMHYSYL